MKQKIGMLGDLWGEDPHYSNCTVTCLVVGLTTNPDLYVDTVFDSILISS